MSLKSCLFITLSIFSIINLNSSFIDVLELNIEKLWCPAQAFEVFSSNSLAYSNVSVLASLESISYFLGSHAASDTKSITKS